jgi:hypothetical protein
MRTLARIDSLALLLTFGQQRQARERRRPVRWGTTRAANHEGAIFSVRFLGSDPVIILGRSSRLSGAGGLIEQHYSLGVAVK